MHRAPAPAAVDLAQFSLVLGGPLYQIWLRMYLSGRELQLLRRRILTLVLVAWAPLLILSIIAGNAWQGGVAVSFLGDWELHARLLLAVPLLIAADLVVLRRIGPLVVQFVERGLIPDSARESFNKAISSAIRLRDSIWPELAIVAFVYLVGVESVWRTRLAFGLVTWNGAPVNGNWQPSLAGWWLACVSLPLFQFLLLRAYYRLFIWARFLWQVSRIRLELMPEHPDGCGGLGFLASVRYAFAPLLLAQGFVLSGFIANRIFYSGAKLPQFKMEVIGLVTIMVFAVLGPLLVFCRQLEIAKRAGMREYGALAQRYVREYDRKWLRGGAPPGESFLGSADIQSLADLGNSFGTVKSMKWVPFGWSTVIQLTAVTALPVAPLVLTLVSPAELLDRLLKIVF